VTARRADDLALLLIQPDAVLQGLTGRITTWVEARGFRPVRYRELWLTPERRTALYRADQRRRMPDWDLGGLLHTLAPVRVLLLRGPAGEGSCAERLTALKGCVVPHLAAAGTLRRELGALNPFCALVHTASDAAAVARESALLLGDVEPGGALTGLTRARGEPPVPTPLWTTVRTAADRLAQRCGGPRAQDGWPADGEGPSPAAMGRFARLWDELTERLRVGNPDAASWMSGIRAGHVSYSGWHNLTGPATATADWGTYLAFTTVRSLDACLQAVARE
jgi:nucleoside diphosphate kinase